MSVTQSSTEFSRAMEPVARALRGEPNLSLSTRNELRFGSRGSLSVDLRKGVWADHETGESGGALDFVKREKRTDRDGALDYLVKAGHIAPPDPDYGIVGKYDYVDQDGVLLFQVVRKAPKKFLQRRPDKQGGWIWKIGNTRRVLYRLPEIIAAVAAGRTIYVVEGEKDVHALEAFGQVATTNPGGAGKWRAEYSSALRGANVVVLPDNDHAGLNHARDVQRALAGIANSVVIKLLPVSEAKQDVADFLCAGGTMAAIEALPAADPGALDLALAVETAAAPSRQVPLIAAQHPRGTDEQALAALSEYQELRSRLAKNDNGNILPSHANLAVILKGDRLLREIVEFNAFTGVHVLCKAVPALDRSMPQARGPYPRPWDGDDVVRLLTYVQKSYAHNFKRTTVEECLMVEGRDHERHDVLDYLGTLIWDQTRRLDQWLTKVFGCELDAYHKAIGSKLLIAAVRRVRQPGCKFDQLPVFEGDQGIGKSSAVAILFSRKWSTDQVSDLSKKDAAIDLRGKWCAELAEIEQLIRADAETVKAFLSRAVDHYRPPYGRVAVDVPRQCILIGTTNATEYLRDATGNRRIWPIRCRSVGLGDLKWLSDNRDQLWAEAAHREANEEAIWLDNAAVAEVATQAQTVRLATDPWIEKIEVHLKHRDEITVSELLDKALFIPPHLQNKAAQMRVGDVLKTLGWKRELEWDAEQQKPVRIWKPSSGEQHEGS